MARMPKCSGPTAWTRGVSRPLGFCSTKPFVALAGGADRRRGMGFSFQEEGCCILNPKGRVGKERDFFAQLTPIPRSFRVAAAADPRARPGAVRLGGTVTKRRITAT